MLASNLHRLRDGTGFVFLRRRFHSQKLAPVILGLSALSWTIGNLLCELTHLIASERVLRVRYEDVCAEPKRELRRIGDFTGLEMESVVQAIQNREELPITHKLAGNRMTRKGSFVFEPERSKGRPIPDYVRRIGDMLTWPLARFYGYT